MNRDELLQTLEKRDGGYARLIEALIPNGDWLAFYSEVREGRREDDPSLSDAEYRVLAVGPSVLVIACVALDAYEEVSTEFRTELRRKGKTLIQEVTPLSQITKVELTSKTGEFLGRVTEPFEEFTLLIERLSEDPIGLPFRDVGPDEGAKVSDEVLLFAQALAGALASRSI